MIQITHCEDCPFNVPPGERAGYCNHPKAPKNAKDHPNWKVGLNAQKSLYYDLGVEENKIPKIPNTKKQYHFEIIAIPKWCPLRNVPHINIPNKVRVNLDKQLFEENFTK
jgi:hypothetical protein